MTNTEHHQNILDTIHATYVAKNHDYGNSFSQLFAEYGLTSSIIRIQDKLTRLKALSKSDEHLVDESIRDTLLDLANYAIMTVMEIEGAK